MIKILFFAQLIELAETDSISMPFKVGLTARLLVDELASEFSKELIDALKYDATVVSINKKIADWDAKLNKGDEVAFLPPFSGG